MSSKKHKKKLEELRRAFYIDELGMGESDIEEADIYLFGFFETLYEIVVALKEGKKI